MGTLSLRARFPNGRTLTLTQLPDTLLYRELLEQIKTKADLGSLPNKVTLAGPPRRELTPPEDATIGSLLKSGDSLIVEPVANPSTNGRPRRRARAKAAAKLSQQPEDEDDDVEWTGDDDVATRPSRPKRRKTGFQAKGYRLDGTVVPAQKATAKKKKKAREAELDNFSLPDVTGNLGGEIVRALQKKPDELDVTGKKFREALQGALQERMAEAEAERRVEAVLAGRYEIKNSFGGLFRVKYRGLHEREWTEEWDGEEMVEYPRELLAAAFKSVLDGNVTEEKERLRMSNMAMVSVRSFWNMVKLFGKDVEGGLRQLVPDGDWTFMDSRLRRKSEKAKRNEENKQEMGWTSD